MPPTAELKSTEAWCNVQEQILKAGRGSHFAPASMPEEEREALLASLNESDAQVERLRAVNEHTPMPGMETCFVSKVVGDQQEYNLTGGKEGTVCYAVNVIKSLRWPGALTVSKGGKYCNIYVGHGLKTGDASMNPTEPPEVQRDPEDQTEMPEPTPLQAPQEPPEPDTDVIPKEEEEEDEQ